MNNAAPQVLLVEDEASIREPLESYLQANGLRVRAGANAQEARALLAAHAFDLAVLDIMMPGEDGLSLCRHIREAHDMGVILLTARAEETDRIVGLEMGADDYVCKPFSPRELLARVKAVLRRANGQPARMRVDAATSSYAFGGWVLNTAERALIGADGVRVSLSTGEYNLLMALLTRAGMVLSREQLLDLTQGRDADPFDRSIDNMISRLRRKIEADPKHPEIIHTVWGGGYALRADVREL